MARKLSFEYSGSVIDLKITKVDRTKIYGRVETETFDANDQRCELVSIARDGRTVIPYGGTATGYINTNGLWIERDELEPVDRDGKKVASVPSSFKAPIKLEQKVPVETFLDHPIRLTYYLGNADELNSELSAELLNDLSGGNIYQFPFSYRGGIYHDPAFLLMDAERELWMLIGHTSDIEYVGFEQAAICAARAQDEAEDEDENDAFDFDML